MTLNDLSWVAFAAGIMSTLLVGKRYPVGWLLGAAGAGMWVFIDAHFGMFGGVAGALLTVLLNLWNWRLWNG